MSQVLPTSIPPFKKSGAPRTRGASQQRFWSSEARHETPAARSTIWHASLDFE
jgi:hypothetical protein